MKFAIYTLGCKVNQYETQAMETELLRRGHTLTSFEENADVYIVNTCTVTAVSDKKSRQVIRQAQKRNPQHSQQQHKKKQRQSFHQHGLRLKKFLLIRRFSAAKYFIFREIKLTFFRL